MNSPTILFTKLILDEELLGSTKVYSFSIIGLSNKNMIY